MNSFLPPAEMTALQERFTSVINRIQTAAARSGRAAQDIQLIAVSKTHPASMVAALISLWKKGSPNFGENYTQEALSKQQDVASLLATGNMPTPEWHFIGHLQSRKAKDITGSFAYIHTLDSIKLGQQIQKAVKQFQLPPQKILIQINIGEERQKAGIFADELETLATTIVGMPELSLQGLMCLPPADDNAESSRPYFVRLRQLRDKLAACAGLALPHLSMGMSHDFEIAIEEGATMVRVGTDIFGARPARL